MEKRPISGRGLTNKRGQRVRDGLLYRSSRADFIKAKDKSLFLQLGIKSEIKSGFHTERGGGEIPSKFSLNLVFNNHRL